MMEKENDKEKCLLSTMKTIRPQRNWTLGKKRKKENIILDIFHVFVRLRFFLCCDA